MTILTEPIPVKSKLLFLALLVIMFFVYRYPHSIQKGPYSIHMWRQADCLSFAKNYLEEGFQFFKPTIHWTTVDHKDQTISDFPIVYYAVSLVWRVFGQHEFIFRLINLIIVYIGLFHLFKFTYEVISDRFWAFYVPLVLFTSPILVFYSNNFLMNAPSLGLVMIALYYYWKFVQIGKAKFLYVGILIYLLAGLLKVTALLSFIAIVIIQLISQFTYFRKTFKISRIGRLIHLLPMIGVFVVVIIWISWAKEYNSQNISGIFLQGLLPIWDVENVYDGLYYGTQLYTFLLPAFLSHTAIIIILALFVWLIMKFRKSDGFLMSLTCISFIGILFFIIFFFKAFSVHDYYLINLLIFVPLTLITFLHYLKSNRVSLFHSKAFKGLAIAALVLLIYNTMVLQRMKYDMGDTFVKHTIILDDNTKKFWKYNQDEYDRRYKALSSITPYLRELGIKRTDLVLSLPDQSPNITLYLMDQKGSTQYGLFRPDGTHKIDQFIESGIKYLIINDPGFLNTDYIQPYLNNKIGEYQNVQIFEMSSP